MFWFEMERASGMSEAEVQVSLRIINLKYSDDSAVSCVLSTAANGSIAVRIISSGRRLSEQSGYVLWGGPGGRRLASYDQSDFEGWCSPLAYDVDANGVVEQADIETFTYFFLNRHSLDYSAFCAQLQQWLDPTLDGR